jgi:peptidoglycan/LPS O-acetylase OafA/YrhL
MNRIKEIDGIRGIAIILVVTFHYVNNQLIDSSYYFGQLMAKITGFGWVGVDLFFVLSGFLIGSVLLNNMGSRNYFTAFYLKRMLRIVPNYFLLISIFTLVKSSGLFDDNYFLTGNDVVPLWSYFLMVHNFFMSSLNNLGNDSICITWSIGIEEQFYLIIPFLLWKLNLKYVPYLMVFFIVISIFSRHLCDNWIDKYVLISCRADSLSIGVIIAWLNRCFVIEDIVSQLKKYMFIVLFLTIILCGYFYIIYGDLGIYKHTLFSLVFFILILFALGLNGNVYGAFLRTPMLCRIGRLSYSLYLFHYMILGFVHHYSGKHGCIIRNINDVLLTFLALVISVGFSVILYCFFEEPFVRIGRKIKY